MLLYTLDEEGAEKEIMSANITGISELRESPHAKHGIPKTQLHFEYSKSRILYFRKADAKIEEVFPEEPEEPEEPE